MQKSPEEIFQKFIETRKILIADSSSTQRSSLGNILSGLGARGNLIKVASSYEDAMNEMESHKPNIVIVDYDLGQRCGLDLLQHHRANNPDSQKSLFILVTGNNSQSAVARAAEEDVDAYLLKPYTANTLRAQIMKTALTKINPSQYTSKINQGKELMKEGELDKAVECFKEAVKLEQSPVLAFYYIGYVNQVKKALEAAEGSYEKGLEINKIHYKCMVGLFDLFSNQKRYEDAYDVAKKISQYFPANPQRLTQVLKLAIFTQSYDDVEKYYQVFTKIDVRNEEVIRYVCAALVVCGKYYLQKKVPSRALELFNKAAVTGAGRGKTLGEIITALVEFRMAKEAEAYLARFPADQQSGGTYQGLRLLIQDELAPAGAGGVIIAQGRDLIAKGVRDPLLHEVMIRRSLKESLRDAAESLLAEAIKNWPEKKAKFDQVFQENVKHSKK
jgi:CheY-like chemotaxis protein